MSRTLYEMVKQIADEEGLKFNTYIKDWVIELEKNDKVMHIYGFRFSNNSSSVDRILSDKSACYEVLNGSNFPAIEHILISKKEEDYRLHPHHRLQYMRFRHRFLNRPSY